MTTIFQDPQNVSTFVDELNYINSLTDVGYGGMFGLIVLITIGACLFLMMKAFKSESALAVTMFITSICGVFLRILGLINNYVLYVCIIVLVGALFLLIKDSANYEQ